MAIAVSLDELVKASRRIVFATPVSSYSRWETLGDQRRIVTFTTLRVDEPVEDDSSSTEHVVRTLGGRVGNLGQIVHGEPLFIKNQPGLLFLRDGQKADEGLRFVAVRAQGHYLLQADTKGIIRVRPSPNRAELVQRGTSAIQVLSNRTVPEARALVLETLKHAR
jgi:hypothetical protein